MNKFKKGDKVRVISAKNCNNGCGDRKCEFLDKVGIIKVMGCGDPKDIYVFPFEGKTGGCSRFHERDLEHLIKDWND